VYLTRAPVSNLHSLIDIYEEEEDPSTKELLIEKTTITNLDTTLNDFKRDYKNDSKKEKQNLLFHTHFVNVVY
jgi:hypothetical protein